MPNDTIDNSEFSEKNQRLIDVLGIDGVLLLIKEFGGTHIYVPKQDTFERIIRDKSIVDDFMKDINIDDLRKKYNLSENHIRAIVFSKKK